MDIRHAIDVLPIFYLVVGVPLSTSISGASQANFGTGRSSPTFIHCVTKVFHTTPLATGTLQLHPIKTWVSDKESDVAALIERVGERALRVPSLKNYEPTCNSSSAILQEIIKKVFPKMPAELVTSRGVIGTDHRIHTFLRVKDPSTDKLIIVDPTIRQFFTDFIPEAERKRRPGPALGELGIPQIFVGTPDELYRLFVRFYGSNESKVKGWMKNYFTAQDHQVVVEAGSTVATSPEVLIRVQHAIDALLDSEWLPTNGHSP